MIMGDRAHGMRSPQTKYNIYCISYVIIVTSIYYGVYIGVNRVIDRGEYNIYL